MFGLQKNRMRSMMVTIVLLCTLAMPVHAADSNVIQQTLDRIKDVLDLVKNVVTLQTVADSETVAATATTNQATTYQLIQSSYLDGTNPRSSIGGMTRDVAFDSAGNMYVTGGTMAPDFPTTAGAYDRTYATGGNSLGRLGAMDVYVMKFNPQGTLLWSTLLGGPNYDRTYAIEVGPSGEVVVAGRAGEGFPTTAGVVQTAFLNNSANAAALNTEYGRQNGFVTKFDTNGKMLWSSYFSAGIIRDMDVDRNGNIHLVPTGSPMPFPHLTSNAFQKTSRGNYDGMYAKISADGQTLLYGTYLGGSGDDGMHPSVRVNAQGDAYYSAWSQSSDFPLKNAFQTRRNGSADAVLAKFAADGTLLFSTYYGGNGVEQMETHALAIDDNDNAYLGGDTTSTDLRVVGGADPTFSGTGDMFVFKVSPQGALLSSTYVGGNGFDRLEGIMFNNATQQLIVTGNSTSNDFATPGAISPQPLGAQDGALAILTADLSRVIYATHLGGSASDEARAVDIHESTGKIIVGGMTASTNFPVVNALDTARTSTVSPFFMVLQPVQGTVTPPVPPVTPTTPVPPTTPSPTPVPPTPVVTIPAPTLALKSSKNTVRPGEVVALGWSSSNATNCTASGGWDGIKKVSGTQYLGTQSRVGSVMYTLTCTGRGGSVTTSETVTVVTPAQSNIDTDDDGVADAADNCVSIRNKGQDNSDGDARGNACDEDDDNDGIADTRERAGCVFNPSSSCGVVPTETPTPTPTPEVTGTAPTLTFTVSRSEMKLGDRGIFTWSSTGATKCTASESWKGEKDLSGTFTTVERSVIGTDEFRLTCTGSGGSVSKSVTITAKAK